MSKRREEFIETYVDIKCCDHCHGKPRDCIDGGTPSVSDLQSATDLMNRAADALAESLPGLSNDIRWFTVSALRDDLREFIRKERRLAGLAI